MQLKKLPEIVRKRHALTALLSKGFKDLKTVSIPPKLPGSKPSYWFLRVQLDTDKVDCDKDTFCQALIAEGIPVAAGYRYMPNTQDWYHNRRVFGTSGYPWVSPLYKGKPGRQFPCPNSMTTTAIQFNLIVSESWGETEVTDVITAFKKVELAYLKSIISN